MNEHEFKVFLRSRQWNDAQSKFVDHALGDNTLPDAESWEELDAYLKGRDPPASAAVIEEAQYIWTLYVAYTGGQAG